ncbi:MAG: endopeptidase La, partial [Spirochaetales bacterium]|nr:endopeptidase La [Spirochaetales bacterium]
MAKELPLIASKDFIIFPRMVAPLFVSSPPVIRVLTAAYEGSRLFFSANPKNPQRAQQEDDFHTAGTVAKILQLLKLPDDSLRLIVEGQERGVIQRFNRDRGVDYVLVKLLTPSREQGQDIRLLEKSIRSSFKKYLSLNPKIPPEVIQGAAEAANPHDLVDILTGSLPFPREQKLKILAQTKVEKRLESLAVLLESEMEMLNLQREINIKVRRRMEQSQKEYFLNEKMKEIRAELGRGEEAGEVEELESRIRARNPPPEVLEKAAKECQRLAKLQPFSPESGVLRTYLEWLADLPWSFATQDNRDIGEAQRILDADHYGMKKPKERILDFIAVRQIKNNLKGPILCLAGPPGTGKTSLGQSVARALNRNFVRMSLGGVRDEAEIRGHRKTYVGALPGKILQSMKKAGSCNPVFLLDEIDKMSSDFRGDPASALLEVLDPSQNAGFADHYLELPYDLSRVMFITTANSLHSIPYALRDRMEIIEIPGYTEYEKYHIANQFLIPKQLEENGLEWARIGFQKNAVFAIIRNYTMESGVRNLERSLGTIIRKLAREAIAEGRLPSLPAGLPAPDLIPAQESLSLFSGLGPAEAKGPGETEGPAEAREAAETGGPAEAKGPAVPGEPCPDSAPPEGSAQEPPPEPPLPFKASISAASLVKYLGKPRYLEDSLFKDPKPGIAYGMAWTEMGGTLLPVEAAILAGKGELILTGSLGDVMKESA